MKRISMQFSNKQQALNLLGLLVLTCAVSSLMGISGLVGNLDEQRSWLRSYFLVTVASEEGKLCSDHHPRTVGGPGRQRHPVHSSPPTLLGEGTWYKVSRVFWAPGL